MTFENSSIESLTSSLVREYLSRKGLKNTLQSMDGEMPRTEHSISNRAALAKEAHLEKLLKKNKEQPEPLRTMIEILMKYHLERSFAKKDTAPLQQPDSAVNGNDPRLWGSKFTEHRKKKVSRPPSADIQYYKYENFEDLSGLPQEDANSTKSSKKDAPMVIHMQKEKPLARVETPEPASAVAMVTDINRNDTSTLDSRLSSGAKSKRVQRPSSAAKMRGMAGPITSSLDVHDRHSKRSSRLSSIKPMSSEFGTLTSEPRDTLSSSHSSKQRTKSASKNKLRDFGFNLGLEDADVDSRMSSLTEEPDLLTDVKGAERNKSRALEATKSMLRGEQFSDIKSKNDTIFSEDSLPSSSRHGNSKFQEENQAERPGSADRHGSSERPGSRSRRSDDSTPSPKKEAKTARTFGDLEMDDIDDLDHDLGDLQLGPSFKKSKKYVDARPLSLKKAVELKTLIFGTASSSFNDEWMKQGFPFNDLPGLEFGIVQRKGGACGVLASVQAFVLQKMLFSEDRMLTPGDLRPGKRERSKFLAKAIACILWRAGVKKRVILTLPSLQPQYTAGGRCKADGLTEFLMLYHFVSLPDLEDYLTENIGIFESSSGSGCVLFLYSAIFTKSLEKIIEEMDEPSGHLMGAHNYCSQEMVNLILTGRAVSNAHNDVIEVDMGGEEKTIFRGISSRNDVGFLSLFEHYGSCEVGSYYKTPRFPIWVVCSESHFSIFFSLKKNLLSDWRAERKFDLYYYDGLAKQQEEIRLTVDTSQDCPPIDENDLTPPLEHCIRTKWPDAVVDWNGCEPIL